MTRVSIYTDGSHLGSKEDDTVGYGGVVLLNNARFTFCQPLDRKKLPGASNPVAELAGAAYALHKMVNLCSEQPLDIHVFADYLGVQKWSTFEWKAKNPNVCTVLGFLHKQVSTIKDKGGFVDFHHVKGHLGEEFNELADKMAKLGAQGCSLDEIPTSLAFAKAVTKSW